MRILENKNCIEVTCPDCNSRLEVVSTDLNLDMRSRNLYVICAACGTKFYIGTDIIPLSWKDYIQDLIDGDEYY